MSDKLLKYPGSKWNKHIIMMKEPSLQPYLPETLRLSKRSFTHHLDRYSSVFIKPILGGGGRGILKITAKGEGFALSSATRTKYLFNRAQLLGEIMKRCKPLSSYIIQNGIDLLQINGRPIDFRVLLLKEKGEWTYAGSMGKLAAKNRHVTNHCRGGSSLTLKTALQQAANLNQKKIEKIEKRLINLSMETANKLNNYYVNLMEMGLDIAIDQQRKLWIIEANSKPQYELFKDHDDPTLYDKIRDKIQGLRAVQS